MVQRHQLRTNLWLIVIAVCAGIGLFLGLMPGMDDQTRADSQGSWTQTGFLGVARSHLATATLLPNGQVLLAGGQVGQGGSDPGTSNATAATEIYDPANGAFSPTGPMAIARAGHTATLLDDGRVLLVGGVNQAGAYQSTTEVYDSATGSFTSTGTMTMGRAHHVAIKLSGGKVLMIGGYDGTDVLTSVEVYDPATGNFSPTGSMQGARSNFGAVLLHSGTVLVLGGYGSPNSQVLDSAELYDPAQGTFAPTGALHTGRADYYQAVLLQSGDVLVVGGVGPDGQGLSSAEVYSPVSGVFTVTGSMTTGRLYHSLTVFPNGQILVAGGWTGIEEAVLASVEIYDPDIGQFSVTESLVTGRGFHSATLLTNGTVLVTGGSGEASFSSPALASAEVFVCSTCLDSPEAPTQVTAVDLASDQGGTVLLTWTSSTSLGVQEYHVYSSTMVGGPYSVVGTLSDPLITTFHDTGLANDVPHYYVVRAFDGNVESDNSNETIAQAFDNIIPNSPTALIVADIPHDDGTALSLSWTLSISEDVVEQRLYRGLSAGGPYAMVSTIAGNSANSFVAAGLTADTTYYYVLTSFDGTQESLLTSERAGQPQDNRPVATALQIDLVEDVLASITLLGQDPDGSPVTYAITTPPAHGQLSGPLPHMTYSPEADFNGVDNFIYVVSNGTLTSEPAMATLTVLATNDPPSVTPFTLAWTPSPSPNVLEQRVYRSQNSGGPFQLVASIEDPSATTFTDKKGLEVGTTYYYVVRAFDGMRESSNSDEVHGVSGRRSVLVEKEMPVNVVLPGFDLDGDSLSYVIEQFPQQGEVIGEGANLVYTPVSGFVGSDSLTYTVSDGTLSSETGTVTFTVNAAGGGRFTAYNDLAWGMGQLDTNITRYTSPSGGSGLASSGLLVDHATGNVTGVTLKVTGGDFRGTIHATQGEEPNTGDALLFNGIVSGLGVLAYINDINDSQVLTFTGLDSSKTYEVVFTAHRDKYAWDRASLVTLTGADAFTNQSSVATDNPNEGDGVLFSGQMDDSTRLPSDNDKGYVARFTGINPGSDGTVVLTISFDGEGASQYKGKYGSAVMFKEYMGP